MTVALTKDEALVVFELLSRWQDEDRVSEPRNEGEHVALWNLCAVLENELVEPFDPRYSKLVAEAAARLTPED